MKKLQTKLTVIATILVFMLTFMLDYFAGNILAWNGALNVETDCAKAVANLTVNPDSQVIEAKINDQEVRRLEVNWDSSETLTFNSFIRWDTGETWSDSQSVDKPGNCELPSPTSSITPTPTPQRPSTGHPRACENFGKVTIKTESDWLNQIMLGDTPVLKTFVRPDNSDFAIVNAGWQWFSGNPGPTQFNEIYRLTTELGSVQVGDLGDEDLGDTTFWPSFLAGDFTGSALNTKVEFAGDSSSAGSHISHLLISWCAANIVIPTVTPTPSVTPLPTVTPTPGPEPEQPRCTGLSVSPSEGTAPLTVRFNGSGFDRNGSILEYEFDFGDTSGGQPQIWKQKESEATHRYENSGTFTVTLKVKDQGGSWRDGNNDCKKTVTVHGEPKVLALTKGDKLPETGSPLEYLLLAITLGGFGFYVYKRFRLI